jgi:hypothetical protein
MATVIKINYEIDILTEKDNRKFSVLCKKSILCVSFPFV